MSFTCEVMALSRVWFLGQLNIERSKILRLLLAYCDRSGIPGLMATEQTKETYFLSLIDSLLWAWVFDTDFSILH